MTPAAQFEAWRFDRAHRGLPVTPEYAYLAGLAQGREEAAKIAEKHKQGTEALSPEGNCGSCMACSCKCPENIAAAIRAGGGEIMSDWARWALTWYLALVQLGGAMCVGKKRQPLSLPVWYFDCIIIALIIWGLLI